MCFRSRLHGSSKTKDLEDAITHAQGGQPLARAAVEQVPAMRQHGSVAHSVSELRILQIAAGPDGRGQIICKAALSAAGIDDTGAGRGVAPYNLVLQSVLKVRKILLR